MYPVSEEWNQQLNAQIRQASTLLRVEIGTFDQTVNQQAHFDFPAQHWSITAQSQTGLPAQSNAMCKEDGSFSEPPSFTVSFSQPINLKGISFNFGTLSAIPKQIEISALDTMGKQYKDTFEQLQMVYAAQVERQNICSITVSVLKMEQPYSKVCLREMRFGAGYVFTEQEILELNEVRSISPAGLELPRTEMDFSLSNRTGMFNADGDAPILAFLRENQNIALWYGMRWQEKEEWIPAGKWYLESWSAEQQSAKFKAVDRITLLNKTTFEKSVYKMEWKQISKLAQEVLKDAALDETEWSVRDKPITYVMAPIPIISHAQALQLIANRAKMHLYSDRSGKVCIAPFKDTPVLRLENTQVFEGMSVQQSTPLKQVAAQWTLLSYFPNMRQTLAQVYMNAQEGTVRIEHDILMNPEIECSPAAEVKATHYARVSYLNIPDQSGAFDVKIIGERMSEVKYPISLEHSLEGEILEIDNPLMDMESSIDVLEWVKQRYAHKLEYQLDIRGIPQLDVGDRIQLWSDAVGQIVENRLSYNGTFRQTLKILA